ncbi:hypothetical protein [Streptomyces sp. CBMA156]|uniref:hypothetical protein n=1 Tax=Streptomyces sp. CBMA156 TaxID=1930280 RepID=UPI001661913A|nr:hypothetical protein [Streptomyces sp. CBMA156]MBD0672858.1 hypothetical protein [Streptomyces sp. CBMA156]MBD0675790.1 hypothetical protein [Streptomyces sp. CBMA156]
MSTARIPALSASPATHAELLLTDLRGRVLLAPGPDGTDPDLPRGPVPPGEAPYAAARRGAEAVTGLAHLLPGRLLAMDWHPAGAQTLVTYDHPPLTDAQTGTLDDGRRGAPLLVAPADLAAHAPGAARRILALLHARVEGRTAELVQGSLRHPGVLDVHGVLARTRAPVPASWERDGRGGEAEAGTEVHGWLWHTAGLVLLCHDLETGQTALPGGPLEPGEADVPEAALRRVCAGGVHAFVKGVTVIGRRGAGVRAVGFLPGPALAMAPGSRIQRLLVTPEQVLDLCAGQVCRRELEEACRTVDLPGAAQLPDRRPVVAVPAEGMPW